MTGRKIRNLALTLMVLVLLRLPAVTADTSKMDKFAQCLSEKNAVMYGLFWCTHCKEQKDMLGDSAKYLKYVECGVPGTRRETDVCKAMNITHTPTWIFSDNTRHEGVLPLADLAKKTGCKLP